MSKIVIIYDSETGNTKKMAKAVADGASQSSIHEVVVKHVTEATIKDLQSADGIILGSPTYYGYMSNRIKAFIDRSVEIHKQLEGKVGAAFTSSGGTACGAETTLLSLLHMLLIHGMIVQGRSQIAHYGAAAGGAPDPKELASCRDLGERTANLVTRVT
jgi:NAD(P)H dehydrogenase (quinone)